jgi:hypothetical protein
MNTATNGDQGKNQANEPERDESLRGWIAIILGVLFACSTALLFAAGHAYRLGYFYELGFDLTQLPEDFNHTSFWGFAGGTPLALVWLVATLIILLAYGLLLWLSGVLWKAMTHRWRPLGRLALHGVTPGRRIPTHVKFMLAAFLLLPAIYLLAIAYLGMAEFQKVGTRKGRELVQALRTDANAASAKYGSQMIELRFSSPVETVVRGYRLLCTENLCSIYDPDPNIRAIRLLSLDGVREIRVIERRQPRRALE